MAGHPPTALRSEVIESWSCVDDTWWVSQSCNGYFNEHGGPYNEAVLNGEVRLSEAEALKLYERADERMAEYARQYNPLAQERARKVFTELPQSLAGAEWRRNTPEERNRGVIASSSPSYPEYDYFRTDIGDVGVVVRKDHESRVFGLVNGAKFEVCVLATVKPTDIYWGIGGHLETVGAIRGSDAKTLYQQIEASLAK